MRIKIYGSRGTLPFSSRENVYYGGNTLCVKIETMGETLIVDCGSGLAQFQADAISGSSNIASESHIVSESATTDGGLITAGGSVAVSEAHIASDSATDSGSFATGGSVAASGSVATSESQPKLSILLSHLHLDHIIGLLTFVPMQANSQNRVILYTKSRVEQSPLTTQIFGLFRPPYWPIAIEDMCDIETVEIRDNESFTPIEGVMVTPFTSNHQDKTTAFRIDADKSLVYLLDCEIDEKQEPSENIVNYCKDSDIILFDSAYLPEDYEKRRGWGHSSYRAGLRLAERSGCKQMIFCHFSYEYADQTLLTLDRELANASCERKFQIAYDGMEVLL